MSTIRHRPIGVMVLALALSSACGGGGAQGGLQPDAGTTDAAPLGTSTIEIAVATTGDGIIPDGYAVLVDGTPAGRVGANATLAVRALAEGMHTVSFSEMAPFCGTAIDEDVATVNVAPGEVERVSFALRCDRAPAGQILVTGGRPEQGYLVSPDGSSPVSLGFALVTLPSWSHDRTRIAFSGASGISVINIDGTGLVPSLVQGGGAKWSLDDQTLLFLGERAPTERDIYRMGADGSHPQPVFAMPASRAWPEWSPDGTRILYRVAGGAAGTAFWTAKADGSDPVQLTAAIDRGTDATWPGWSPDGSRIAYVSSTSSGGDIVIVGADGSRPTHLTRTPSISEYMLTWSPDGKWLAHTEYVAGVSSLWIRRVDGTQRARVSLPFDNLDFLSSWRL